MINMNFLEAYYKMQDVWNVMVLGDPIPACQGKGRTINALPISRSIIFLVFHACFHNETRICEPIFEVLS